MTSILTNASSMAALQSLKAVSSNLSATQNQISTGLRISEASHNAAYWSIATTMRSDNKASSVVQDALGLGAARVDVAYAAMSSVVDVLTNFNAKVLLAKDDTTNRGKIQTELDSLKQHLAGIATSATFAGVNWLNTDNPGNLANLSAYGTEIISSYSRSPEGQVRVGAIDVNLIATSLFNTGGGGALQEDIRSLGDIGGFRGQADRTVPYSPAYGGQTFKFTAPVTFGDDDVVRLSMTVDAIDSDPGQTFDIVIDKNVINTALGTSDGYIGSAQQLSRVLNEALDQAGGSVYGGISYDYTGSQSYIYIVSREQIGSGSSISTSLAETTLSGNTAMGFEGTPSTFGNYFAGFSFNFSGPFRVHNDVNFGFELTVGHDSPVMIGIDRAMVDTVLGTTDGVVQNADQLAAILGYAVEGHGLNVTAAGNSIELSVDRNMYPDAGSRSAIEIGKVTDNVGLVPNFNILDVDITAPAANLDNYLNGISAMLGKVTSAASELGAIKKRLDMQADFTSKLRDSVDRGIGQLVDADMDRASTRLNALQVQQQLATQSLQIANANSQSVLSLFR